MTVRSMAAYLLSQKGLFELLSKLQEAYSVFVPERKGEKRFFAKYESPPPPDESSGGIGNGQYVIGEVRTAEPLKMFYLRSREMVADGYKDTVPRPEQKPYCIVGAKACDLKGFKVQDRVFKEDEYIDPFYIQERNENLIISSIDYLILEIQNKINDYFKNNPRNKTKNKSILNRMPKNNNKTKFQNQLSIIEKITNNDKNTLINETNKEEYLFNLLTIWSELCCNNIFMNDIFKIYREQLNKIETINKFYSFNNELDFNNVYIKDNYIYYYEKANKDHILDTTSDLIGQYLRDYNRSLFNVNNNTFFYDDRTNNLKQFSYFNANELNEIFDYNKIEEINRICLTNSIYENIDCNYYKTIGFLLQQANSATLTKFNLEFLMHKSNNTLYPSLNNRDFIIIEQNNYFIFIILYSITVSNPNLNKHFTFNKTLQI